MKDSVYSQNQMILARLKKCVPITPLDALRDFGTLRLGARVWDLEQKGYTILRRWKKVGQKRVREYYGAIKQRAA